MREQDLPQSIRDLFAQWRAEGKTVVFPSRSPIELSDPTGTRTTAPIVDVPRSMFFGEPTWRGKKWSDLTPSEKHELHVENIELYRAMRAADHTWRGKTFDALSKDEKITLHREDPERFARMRGLRKFNFSVVDQEED